ncbi:DNA-processing protein DprA [Polaromonas sp. A23]|uniref:DNA-processing protein DprA n=1 Tax=Polaromonas sp. A23 TaxID=1944133 RepID=UPI0009855D8C|nr:DNA-processing protein DprA [Polaromonas sp. A23]OOG48427.1 DNA protecting protein DprA [Polaromonas sp. A23]
MEASELGAWLRLSLTPGIGNTGARQLLAAFGSPEAIFDQDAAALRQLGSDRLVSAVQTEPATLAAQLQIALEWLRGADNRHIIPLGDSAYPPALLDIEDPPSMLYMVGTLDARLRATIQNRALCLAIVGSRNPTPQGENNARQFAKAFGEAGLCVVSGMALGVDGAAHDGALLGGGPTLAVVGTGLDRVYPKQHLALAHRIAEHGLIISEFPLGTPPLTANFPKRNRLISGLSQGTLVIEAALKSGSLITARLAAEQGREVFAIPGSIHSPQSRGCHALIKQGAKLVESAQDVLEELDLPHVPAVIPANTDLANMEPEDSLLAAMGFEPVSLDALQARTGLATAILQARLLDLEMGGELARLPGGLFQRMATV